MLQLDPKNEELRDTLFYHIFKNSLLFDDLDSGMKYRRTLIKERKRPPAIFTVDGNKIGVDAVLDPKKGKKPDDLRHIFGMQPAGKSIVFTNLLTGTQALHYIRLHYRTALHSTTHSFDLIIYLCFMITLDRIPSCFT